MKGQKGFTFIEVIVFIVVTSLMATALFLAFTTSLRNVPSVYYNTIAGQTAKSCMEWFLGQRRLNGYSAFTCPSSAVPALCTAPSGFSLAVNITCTTISADTNYQTIAVTVSGKASANLTTLVGNY